MSALLSIKPTYAEAILSGIKKWEFRRRKFMEKPDRVYIYCTSPVRRVVGFFEPGEIISGSSKEIWRKCGKDGAISRKEFFKYSNSGTIHAIKILRVEKLEIPMKLNLLGKNKAPQSFCYINVGQFQFKLRKFFYFLYMFKRFGHDTSDRKRAKKNSETRLKHPQSLP